MKNLLKITAATAALALGVSGANAAMLLHTDPETDQKVVINTETQSEAEVLAATNGQPPVDCPEGAFFLTVDPTDQSEIVNACVTGEQWFVGQADDGTFAAQGHPEGTFLLTQDPISDQGDVISGEEAERRAAPMGVEPQQ